MTDHYKFVTGWSPTGGRWRMHDLVRLHIWPTALSPFGRRALAAQEHEVPLATRDARAQGTYEAAGVKVIVVT
jgi:hypothetical protein